MSFKIQHKFPLWSQPPTRLDPYQELLRFTWNDACEFGAGYDYDLGLPTDTFASLSGTNHLKNLELLEQQLVADTTAKQVLNRAHALLGTKPLQDLSKITVPEFLSKPLSFGVTFPPLSLPTPDLSSFTFDNPVLVYTSSAPFRFYGYMRKSLKDTPLTPCGDLVYFFNNLDETKCMSRGVHTATYVMYRGENKYSMIKYVPNDFAALELTVHFLASKLNSSVFPAIDGVVKDENGYWFRTTPGSAGFTLDAAWRYRFFNKNEAFYVKQRHWYNWSFHLLKALHSLRQRFGITLPNLFPGNLFMRGSIFFPMIVDFSGAVPTHKNVFWVTTYAPARPNFDLTKAYPITEADIMFAIAKSVECYYLYDRAHFFENRPSAPSKYRKWKRERIKPRIKVQNQFGMMTLFQEMKQAHVVKEKRKKMKKSSRHDKDESSAVGLFQKYKLEQSFSSYTETTKVIQKDTTKAVKVTSVVGGGDASGTQITSVGIKSSEFTSQTSQTFQSLTFGKGDVSPSSRKDGRPGKDGRHGKDSKPGSPRAADGSRPTPPRIPFVNLSSAIESHFSSLTYPAHVAPVIASGLATLKAVNVITFKNFLDLPASQRPRIPLGMKNVILHALNVD